MPKLSNFQQRTLTGALFVGAILASLLHPIAFFVVFLSFFLGAFQEYKILLKGRNVALSIYPQILGILVYCGVFYMLYSERASLSSLSCLVGLLAFFSLLAELYRKKEDPMGNAAFAVFSFLYLTLPFALLLVLYDGSPLFVLALFMMVWSNDTFAYLVGITLGRHRLFERISPKKSWEGAVGGLVFTLLTAAVFAYFVEEMNLIQWLGMASIVVVFSTFGDLFESLFKRSLEVKDSGVLLPGHGGFLDRFDSILFAAPAVSLYLLLILV